MINAAMVAETNHWLSHFQAVWSTGVPIKLHERDLDDAGNPDWTPEFAHWLDGTTGRHEGLEDRARLKRAMKRLRERSLREYEVFYRVLVLGHAIPEVTDWLNDRAIAGGHPERYEPRDTMVIVYAAVDKIGEWY